MLGLGEYGSSDEEDKSAQVSAVSVSSKGSSKKKMKRVMGLSAVLPPEIRQLLESGGGGDDEDEEDNWSASKSAAARREARATVAPVSNEIKQHGLFALLPKQPAGATTSTEKSAPRIEKSASDSSEPKGLVAEVGIHSKTDKDSDIENDENEDDEDEEEEDITTRPAAISSFFSTPAPGAAPSSVAQDYSVEIAQPATTPAPAVWQEVKDLASGDSYFWNATTGETSWDRPTGCLVTEYAPVIPTPHPLAEAASTNLIPQGTSGIETQAVGKARRARDRDLERALEAGDFEALGEGQASVVLQPDTSTWNPHRKGAADTKQEVKIASLSYDPRTGESATTFNPSKVQKRKHQINSLAVSAAERELELMEARGNSMKTKSQTQAKYGW